MSVSDVNGETRERCHRKIIISIADKFKVGVE